MDLTRFVEDMRVQEKVTRRRLLGWTLLAISFLFTAGTMLYLVHAP